MATQQPPVTQLPAHGPYPPRNWALGGIPTKSIDIPVTAVFLALFLGSAAIHMTIFQLNKKRGHKFMMSLLLFIFSMARVVACVMRIAAISVPHNTRLNIAASVFVLAGVVIIFIVNLEFAKRMIRAQHHHIGWNALFRWFFIAIYSLIVITIIMAVTTSVQSLFTLNPNTLRIDRDIALYASTFFAFVTFLPILLVIGGLLLPKRHRVDKFGIGRWRTKVRALLTASFLICLGACYRCGTAWMDPVPRTQPMPRYFHRAAFYIFNFTIEIIVVYLYALIRVDLRFHVPDGARGPGSYNPVEHMGAGKEDEVRHPGRLYTEEETFDDQPESGEDENRASDAENGASRKEYRPAA